MLSSQVYINGIGVLSPAGGSVEELFAHSDASGNTCLRCVEPGYAGFIEPANIRRMGRLIKMAMVAAKKCLADSQVAMPDAIITGTGFGCMEETEKFLKTVLSDEGSMASPTAFIHSTHNTISSQIAISLKCTGYNSTYVHRAFSFENALIDAVLQLHESRSGEIRNLLVGGVDEITPSVFEIMRRLNFWKNRAEANHLYGSTTQGTVAGEGVVYFTVSNQASAACYAQLRGVKTLYKPAGTDEVNEAVLRFLNRHDLQPADIDLVVLGNNGDTRFDHYYHGMAKLFNQGVTLAGFKHLCGEYFTAAAFGLLVTAVAIRNNILPPGTTLQQGTHRPFRKALLYNQFRGIEHCFYLLSNVEV